MVVWQAVDSTHVSLVHAATGPSLIHLRLYSLRLYSLRLYSLWLYSLRLYSLRLYSLQLYSLQLYSLQLYSPGLFLVELLTLAPTALPTADGRLEFVDPVQSAKPAN